MRDHSCSCRAHRHSVASTSERCRINLNRSSHRDLASGGEGRRESRAGGVWEYVERHVHGCTPALGPVHSLHAGMAIAWVDRV